MAADAGAALLWSACMGASAFHALGHWADPGPAVLVSGIFAAGGLLALPPARFMARRLAGDGGLARRFAATGFCLAGGTLAATALIFVLEHRSRLALPHEDMPPALWAVHQAFAAAAALYQFTVLALPLYLPLGLIALFAFSLWYARHPR